MKSNLGFFRDFFQDFFQDFFRDFLAGRHGSEINHPKKTTKDTRQAASWSVRAPEEWRQQQPMAKMISLFGSVSSSRSELMRVGEVQCHWLTLNEAFMACSQVRSCRAPSPSRITGYIMGTLDIPTRGHSQATLIQNLIGKFFKDTATILLDM